MQEFEADNPRKKRRPAAAAPVPAWEQALRWLDARWYSEKMLTAKLAARGYPDGEIEDVLEKCRRYGLVDDIQLATEFARSQNQRGRGSRRIRMELARHGLNGDAAKLALNLIAPDEAAAAGEALKAKLKSWSRETDWRRRREKAFRFLAGRGFGPDTVRGALDAEPSLNYGADSGNGHFEDENGGEYDDPVSFED